MFVINDCQHNSLLITAARTMLFMYPLMQGALVEAVRQGWWILLDEINLASAETLQCLSSLLEGPDGSFLLAEKG